MRARQWLFALLVALWRRLRRASREPSADAAEQSEPARRIVAAGTPERRAENVVLALLAIACLFALGFTVTYAEFSPGGLPNELLGVCLGMCLLLIGAALTVIAKRLVVTEELEDDYPEEHPEQQREVAEIIRESGSRITRKRLLLGAGAATGGALGLAALTPALSIGPLWDTAAWTAHRGGEGSESSMRTARRTGRTRSSSGPSTRAFRRAPTRSRSARRW